MKIPFEERTNVQKSHCTVHLGHWQVH